METRTCGVGARARECGTCVVQARVARTLLSALPFPTSETPWHPESGHKRSAARAKSNDLYRRNSYFPENMIRATMRTSVDVSTSSADEISRFESLNLASNRPAPSQSITIGAPNRR